MKIIWAWLVLITATNADEIQGPKEPTKPWRGIGRITFRISDNWEKSGTCVLVQKDIVLTAESLVRNEAASVEFPDGIFTGIVIASHQRYNWALIKLQEIPDAKPIPLSPVSPAIGSNAWLFGYGEYFGVTPVVVKSDVLLDGAFQMTTIPKTEDLGAPIISQDSKLIGLYTDYRDGTIYGFGLENLTKWIDENLNTAPPKIAEPAEIKTEQFRLIPFP
jgi:hypothetical protein